MAIDRFQAALLQSVDHRLLNHEITGSIAGIGKYLRTDFRIFFFLLWHGKSPKGLAIQLKKYCCLVMFVNVVSFMSLCQLFN